MDLTSAHLLDTNEITSLLENICRIKNVNVELSLRKMRLVLLKKLIDHLSNDPIYDLIEISGFWLSLGNPPDSPHIIQGVDNDITPEQYYTSDYLKKILAVHKEWIIDEMKKLRNIK